VWCGVCVCGGGSDVGSRCVCSGGRAALLELAGVGGVCQGLHVLLPPLHDGR
jgi:hypothetical protein